MYVTDTHGFLWSVWADKKLGKRAFKIFRECDEGKETVIIPTIVLLECMYVCEKRKEEFKFREIMEKVQGSRNYQIYPLDEEVLLKCDDARSIPEMHDRIIVGTAILLNAKLITKDSEIVNSKIIETIW